ncbi:MAG: MFS transporter, partial [Erysipelotrichaceae bacterium]|nr:MFS transporter [Erysipelotrichaceae bacterium]
MSRKKNWPLRLAMVEFTYWFALGTVNYLTVYLEGNGFSVTQVGLINTVNALAATLFSPVAGVISDKIRSSLKGMIVFTTAMCICYALVPLTMKIYVLGMSLMIVFSALYYAFSVPSESLLETTVVRGCENTGTDFATIRIGGTLGYVVVCALLSYFVTDDNVVITFYLLGLLILPAFYAMSRIKEVSDSSDVQERIALKDLPFGKLFRNPYFVCYAIFTILHFVPQMSVYYFQPYLIKDVGASMTYVGYLQAYRALFEVPALLFSY